MFSRFFLISCFLLTLTGCVAKGRFVQDLKPVPSVAGQGKTVVLLAPLADDRIERDQIDKFYDGDPLKDLQLILQRELIGTNLFNRVITASDLTRNDLEADIVIEPALEKLEWVVPGYKEILAKSFLYSLFTVGIGGVIYGSTETDVQGNTTLHVRVKDRAKGDVLLSKSYDGHYEEQMAKLQCDTPNTRMKMAGTSFHRSVSALTSDLKKLLASPAAAVVSSSGGQEPN